MELLERIEALIRRKDLGVLATIGSQGPHTSLMTYACPPDILHLYLLTPTRSMKYRNILNNPMVSLLIDTREESPRQQVQALTVSGRAVVVESAAHRRSIAAVLVGRHPQLTALTTSEEVAVLQVIPTAFQLLDGVAQSQYLTVDPAGGGA